MDQLIETPKVEVRETGSKKTLIGIVLILVALVVYVFYVRPLSVSVGDLKDEVNSLQGELDVLSSQLATLDEAKDALGLSNEVEAFEVKKMIPSELQQDEVIRNIIEIAKVHDIELKSLGFGKGGTENAEVGSLRINSSFVGNYTDLVGFLEGLEQNSRLLKVNSISVQIDKLDLLGFERATFSLSMEAFFQE